MIRNLTKNTVVIDKTRMCRSAICKGFGLMFRPVPDYGLVFVFKRPRRVAITMLFVFYPIDVLFLDEDKKVVETAKLEPFSHYKPSASASYVVELKAGLARTTKVGDVLDF